MPVLMPLKKVKLKPLASVAKPKAKVAPMSLGAKTVAPIVKKPKGR